MFNKVRAMLIGSGLPKQLWTEAVLHHTEVQNMMVNSTTKETPYWRWFGVLPDISGLRIFGSLSYLYVPEIMPRSMVRQSGIKGTGRKKLDYRSQRGIYIGSGRTAIGWRFLHCETGKIIETSHATVDESESPASMEYKRLELMKLSRIFACDFNYYSQQAVSSADFLFYSNTSVQNEDLTAIERFVNEFDMASLNLVTVLPELEMYNKIACGFFASDTIESYGPSQNLGIAFARGCRTLSAMVAAENIQSKLTDEDIMTHRETNEPKNYNEALRSSDSHNWIEAINKEIKSLEDNQTWTYVHLPGGKRALSSLWVLRVKYKPDGTVERYKARLVVRGCQQTLHIDYEEIFAPVVRMDSIRILLAIVCIENLECHQMDIDTAFLNGELDEEVYMEIPQGISKRGRENLVCKLNKSLYGLKQAPRQWHKALTEYLLNVGFQKLLCEACIYVKDGEDRKMIIAIYVDDLVFIS